MADANRILLSYVLNDTGTYGGIPSGPPNLQDLRLTGESLAPTYESQTSEELRSDEQKADLIRTGVGMAGDINFELSYGSYDEFLRAVWKATAWSNVVTATISISFAAADNSINDALNGFVSAGFVANQWIRLTKAAGANAAQLYVKIVSVAVGKIIVSGETLVNETAISTEIEMGAQIVNGTSFSDYATERKYTDETNNFARMLGVVINSFALDVRAKSRVTGSFGVIGKSETTQTSTIGDGTNLAASTTKPMNSIANVVKLLQAQASFKATEFSMQIGRNHRARDVIGVLGADSIGSGSIDAQGVLRFYYSSAAMFTKLENDTETSLAIVLKDGAGNAYVFEFPAVKFQTGRRVGGGLNQDVIADLPWTAYMHATEGITMRAARFAA